MCCMRETTGGVYRTINGTESWEKKNPGHGRSRRQNGIDGHRGEWNSG